MLLSAIIWRLAVFSPIWPCIFFIISLLHKQDRSAFWDLFITTGIQFLSANEQKCHIISILCWLVPLIWLFHWELTCETLSGMYVKIKSEKVDIISHPFHIYFTTQNFTSMRNMHVKCLWKVCEKHVKIGHLSPCFHMTFTDILLAVVEHKHFRPVI